MAQYRYERKPVLIRTGIYATIVRVRPQGDEIIEGDGGSYFVRPIDGD